MPLYDIGGDLYELYVKQNLRLYDYTLEEELVYNTLVTCTLL